MLGRLINIMARKPKQNGLTGFNITSVICQQNKIAVADNDELIEVATLNETADKLTRIIQENNFEE